MKDVTIETIVIVTQDIKDRDQDLMEEDIKDITVVIVVLKETQGIKGTKETKETQETRIDVPEEARIIEAQEIITTGIKSFTFIYDYLKI